MQTHSLTLLITHSIKYCLFSPWTNGILIKRTNSWQINNETKSRDSYVFFTQYLYHISQGNLWPLVLWIRYVRWFYEGQTNHHFLGVVKSPKNRYSPVVRYATRSLSNFESRWTIIISQNNTKLFRLNLIIVYISLFLLLFLRGSFWLSKVLLA